MAWSVGPFGAHLPAMEVTDFAQTAVFQRHAGTGIARKRPKAADRRRPSPRRYSSKEVQVQSVLERIVQLNQESSEVSRRIGLAACESFDECLRAQMEANRELLQGHAVGLAGLRDNVALAKLPAAYLRYWQKVFENTRDWFEAGVRTQTAFAGILFDHANPRTTAISRLDDSAAGVASDPAHQRPRERHRHAA
jgi:hypothetical protein